MVLPHRRSASAPALDVGEQGGVGDGEMAHLAALVQPGAGEAGDLGEALDDLVRARTSEREVHQRELQLLGALVQEGPLVEDEADAGVMRVGGVDPVG